VIIKQSQDNNKEPQCSSSANTSAGQQDIFINGTHVQTRHHI
jgi:hypothetical protein